jgi:hypothetical protein
MLKRSNMADHSNLLTVPPLDTAGMGRDGRDGGRDGRSSDGRHREAPAALSASAFDLLRIGIASPAGHPLVEPGRG